MQKKLITSIHIDPTQGHEQTTHALTANITTRQGFDLHIAAVSQKKPGTFASIDTPRKTLLSFVTSLQNGSERSIEQIIHRAINLVTISTGGYTKRRGGAPCGLTAGILFQEHLYTIKIGSGEILYLHQNGLRLLTQANRPVRQIWLGEAKDLTIQQVNMQKAKLGADSTIVVCQPDFVQGIVDQGDVFKRNVAAMAKEPADLAENIAQWARLDGISQGLTMAVQHWPKQEDRPAISDEIEVPHQNGVDSTPATIAPLPLKEASSPTTADLQNEDSRGLGGMVATGTNDSTSESNEVNPQLEPSERVDPVNGTTNAMLETMVGEPALVLQDLGQSNIVETEPADEPADALNIDELNIEDVSDVIKAALKVNEPDHSAVGNIETLDTEFVNDSIELPSIDPIPSLDELPLMPESLIVPSADQPVAKRPIEEITTADREPFVATTAAPEPTVAPVEPTKAASEPIPQPEAKIEPEPVAPKPEPIPEPAPQLQSRPLTQIERLIDERQKAEQTQTQASERQSEMQGVDTAPAVDLMPNQLNGDRAAVAEKQSIPSTDVQLKSEPQPEFEPDIQPEIDLEPSVVLPSNVIEVDLMDSVHLSNQKASRKVNFSEADEEEDLDTQRMEPVSSLAAAPVFVEAPASNGTSAKNGTAELEDNLDMPQKQGLEASDIADRSRLVRLSMLGAGGLFLAVITIGIFLTLQRIMFADGSILDESTQPALVSAETLPEAGDGGQNAALTPVEVGPAVGYWSQGSSQVEYTIHQGSGLGARGLISFAIGGQSNEDGTVAERSKNIYAWPGSTFDFDKHSAGATFGVNEKSTLFLDSTAGTLRPELARLFGTAESSAGCMSINYRSVDEPVVMSCYSGTCRWLGPLNRNFDIPAGQRLAIMANSRTDDGVVFEPIYRTEATVFAKTLAIAPQGKAISAQCIDPYIESGRQLTVEETTAVSEGISDSLSRQIGYAIQGNTNSRRIVDSGDTLNIRGLTRVLVGDADDPISPVDYEFYAWPDAAIHFNPNLGEDQFEIGDNTSVFLNSSGTIVRPYVTDIFGTAVSENGCMSMSYKTADQPIVISCYSGRCQWNGALDRTYEIPVGQRLAVPANPRSDADVQFSPVFETETAVVARTIGSIPVGRVIADTCVEPYLTAFEEPEQAPNVAEPTPESEASESDLEEEALGDELILDPESTPAAPSDDDEEVDAEGDVTVGSEATEAPSLLITPEG